MMTTMINGSQTMNCNIEKQIVLPNHTTTSGFTAGFCAEVISDTDTAANKHQYPLCLHWFNSPQYVRMHTRTVHDSERARSFATATAVASRLAKRQSKNRR